MSLILQIVPFSDELNMFGEPDPSSAYSLSGHVAISVAASYSFFDSRRPIHLLQSLSLTFEGQSEIFTQDTGYSSVRLCSITRELVSAEPIELSNEGKDDLSIWNIVFNLNIPGWLPASSAIGVADFGVKYSLTATARFMSHDGDHSISSWSPLAVLCAPFRPRFRSSETCKTIKLCRFINPPTIEIVDVPMINYLVNSNSSGTKVTKDGMPSQVLSRIQVLVSVPDFVDVKAKEVALAIRLRTKDLCEEECRKLQLAAVSFDLVQNEKFRCRPTPSYLAQYPIPSKEMQPPNLPLRDSHPMSLLYPEIFTSSHTESASYSFSLLLPSESGEFKLDDNNYVFKDDRREDIPTWYTINTTLPFNNSSTTNFCTDGTVVWTDFLGLRPSTCEPLLSVRHQLAISLTILYDLEDGRVAKEVLDFKIPLTFANVAPVIPSSAPPLSSSGSMVRDISPSSSTSTLLPAYSQLYDRNGERKFDYSIPLPLYTPRAAYNGDGGDKGCSWSTPTLEMKKCCLSPVHSAENTTSSPGS